MARHVRCSCGRILEVASSDRGEIQCPCGRMVSLDEGSQPSGTPGERGSGPTGQAGAIRARCPGCGKTYKVAATHAGKRVKCPGCGHVFTAAPGGARPRTGGRQRPGGPETPRVGAPAPTPSASRPAAGAHTGPGAAAATAAQRRARARRFAIKVLVVLVGTAIAVVLANCLLRRPALSFSVGTTLVAVFLIGSGVAVGSKVRSTWRDRRTVSAEATKALEPIVGALMAVRLRCAIGANIAALLLTLILLGILGMRYWAAGPAIHLIILYPVYLFLLGWRAQSYSKKVRPRISGGCAAEFVAAMEIRAGGLGSQASEAAAETAAQPKQGIGMFGGIIVVYIILGWRVVGWLLRQPGYSSLKTVRVVGTVALLGPLLLLVPSLLLPAPRDALDLNHQGVVHFRAEDYDRALEYFTEAIEVNPQFAKPYSNRGLVYNQKGKFDLAIADFSKAIELAPDFAEPYWGRGVACRAAGKLDQSIQDLTKNLSLRPRHSWGHYQRGLTYIAKKDNQKAVEDFTKAAQLMPKYPLVYHRRGVAYIRQEDYERAITDFSRTIQMKTDHAEAYRYRGIAHYRTKAYDSAVADFTKYLEMQSDDADGYDWRGLCHRRKGAYELAIADFTKAVELAPKTPRFAINRGIARAAADDNDQALADFDRALALDPKNEWAYRCRGIMLRKKRDYDAAVEALTQAINLKPESHPAHFARGATYFCSGAFEKAADDFLRCTQIRSDSVSAHLWLFLARTRAGQEARTGLADFQAGLQDKDWPAPAVQLYLGKLTPDAMLAEIEQQQPPADNDVKCAAYFYTGQYHLLNGRNEQAASCFRKCLETLARIADSYDAAEAELRRITE